MLYVEGDLFWAGVKARKDGKGSYVRVGIRTGGGNVKNPREFASFYTASLLVEESVDEAGVAVEETVGIVLPAGGEVRYGDVVRAAVFFSEKNGLTVTDIAVVQSVDEPVALVPAVA